MSSTAAESRSANMETREYAAQKQLLESDALIVGMNEKAEEFKNSGGEIYSKR